MNKHYTLSRSFALLFCFLLLTTAAMAQAVLSGTVRGANGQPLSGASVNTEGSMRGTTTDNNGTYLLNVAPGRQTLVYHLLVLQRKE